MLDRFRGRGVLRSRRPGQKEEGLDKEDFAGEESIAKQGSHPKEEEAHHFVRIRQWNAQTRTRSIGPRETCRSFGGEEESSVGGSRGPRCGCRNGRRHVRVKRSQGQGWLERTEIKSTIGWIGDTSPIRQGELITKLCSKRAEQAGQSFRVRSSCPHYTAEVDVGGKEKGGKDATTISFLRNFALGYGTFFSRVLRFM